MEPFGSGSLWAELLAYGSAVAISPIHIGLLLLLLLGPQPLQRGGWFVVSWMVTTGLMVVLLLTLGHGLLLSMEKGSHHRTGLDLLAAGALLALGLKELLERRADDEASPGWTRQLDRFSALPLPVLLSASCALELISPDDLFLFAKTASCLLAAGLNRIQEGIGTAVFASSASLALLLPWMAVLIGRKRVMPLLEGTKALLFKRGDLVVASLSLLLAGYLGWQGIEGLQLS